MSTTKAQGQTVVKVFPQSISFGSGDVVGENFSVTVVIEDVSDLYAFDVQFSWNVTYLSYLSHTGTFPKDDYPTPISPSPYAGVLWEGSNPVLVLANTVDEVAGTYRVAASSLGVVPSFNDNATVFVMTFEVIDQPAAGEADVVLDLDITSSTLSDPSATGIPHTVFDGTVTIPSIPFTYPPLPLIKIMPESIEDVELGTSFPVDVYLMGEGGGDLDGFWDVAGFDIYVNYNTTLLEATDIMVDPDNWFTSFYPFNLSIAEDFNNTLGVVHVAFVGYGEPHTPPSGSGRLFNITFQSIYESDTLPLPSEPIYLENPTTFIGSATLDSIGGLIDTADPVGTEWFNLTPGFGD
ncbi:MAG: cohesin domain-containing protein, partial [Candidatus Bathyarchaeota archaeon]|nr:cohesin domain-containing protein [Candidatus Bathyarchaeota archaeon]